MIRPLGERDLVLARAQNRLVTFLVENGVKLDSFMQVSGHDPACPLDLGRAENAKFVDRVMEIARKAVNDPDRIVDSVITSFELMRGMGARVRPLLAPVYLLLTHQDVMSELLAWPLNVHELQFVMLGFMADYRKSEADVPFDVWLTRRCESAIRK